MKYEPEYPIDATEDVISGASADDVIAYLISMGKREAAYTVRMLVNKINGLEEDGKFICCEMPATCGQACVQRGMWQQRQADKATLSAPEVQGEREADAKISNEILDRHIDKVLRATGSAFRYYTLPKTIDDMRDAMRAAISAKGEE